MSRSYHGKLSNYAPRRSGSKFGTYTAPKAVGTKVITKSARLRKSPSNSLCISNRELAYSVIFTETAGTYSVTTFQVQPGLSSIFPLLSNTAKSFTRYKMKFCADFVPAVGTDTEGTIFMAFNRNLNEAPPSSVQQFMTYAGATNANIWSQSSFPSNRGMVKPSEKMLYTRYTSLVEGEDILQYDMGNFHVALSGIGTVDQGTVLGQIYITYEVHFYDQRVLSSVEANLFTYYPSNPVDGFDSLANNSETELAYVFGGGDVLYTGSVGWESGVADPLPGVTLVFPSAGFYAITQRCTVTFSGTPASDTFFEVYPFGGQVIPEVTNPMVGYTGSTTISSEATIIEPAIFSAVGATSEATCFQIIQVLTSGTYLVNDDVVIGGGWVSKQIGTSSFGGGSQSDTNEVEIYETSAGAGESAVIKYWDIEAQLIDAEIASYFFPSVFGSTSGMSLSVPKPRSVRKHLLHSAVKGLGIRSHRPKAKPARSGRSQKQCSLPVSSEETPTLDPVPSEPEPRDYDSYLLWKKKQMA